MVSFLMTLQLIPSDLFIVNSQPKFLIAFDSGSSVGEWKTWNDLPVSV